jgi:hypothetical protein
MGLCLGYRPGVTQHGHARYLRVLWHIPGMGEEGWVIYPG